MNRTVIVIFFAFIMQAASTTISTAQTPGKERKISEKSKNAAAKHQRVDFTLKTLGGKVIHLSDYSGKVVLVNIWAPWCGPCRVETPGFVSLYDQYKEKGFEIISIAVNTNEREVTSFMLKHGIRWPVGINEDIAASFGTTAIPNNYLFGPDGAMIKHWIGFTGEQELKSFIVQAMKKPS
ncbi:MAG: TlpA family protein disulfide reductase [Ignavibacteriales bacterium]|nr:TlpA family protein disulfide reductase [Ignavibacteriales bacterium]